MWQRVDILNYYGPNITLVKKLLFMSQMVYIFYSY